MSEFKFLENVSALTLIATRWQWNINQLHIQPLSLSNLNPASLDHPPALHISQSEAADVHSHLSPSVHQQQHEDEAKTLVSALGKTERNIICQFKIYWDVKLNVRLVTDITNI